MEKTKLKQPLSWECVKLGTFVENEKGKKPKRQSTDKTEEFALPYVDIEAFEDCNIKSWTDGDGCRLCYESDFLMVWDGSRSGLVGKGIKGALGSTLVRINFPGMNNQYAYYFLLSKYQQINTRAKGSGTPHVDPDLLWNYDFPIAPLNEQKRIVAKIEELFSELDNGIRALKTASEQLKVYRQAVLKHAFEGKLTAKWSEGDVDKLETSEQLLTRIQQECNSSYQKQLEKRKAELTKWEAKNKEGKKPGKPKKYDDYSSESLDEQPYKLPITWAWVHLGELVTGIDQGWSPKCENVQADIDNWGVIKTTAVQHGEFIEYENKMLPDNLKPRQQHELVAGDILITRAGPRIRVGVCCLVKKVRTKLMNCDKVYRIRGLENVCLPEYLEAVLNSPVILDTLESVKSGINDSGVNLNQGAFLNMLIPYCNLTEQKKLISKVEEILSIINKQQEIIEIALKQADTLRQSVLKKAFSGELVPQDSNDEPVSELLARIMTEKVQKKQSVKKSKTKHCRNKSKEQI